MMRKPKLITACASLLFPLLLAGCGGNAPYSPIISQGSTTNPTFHFTTTTPTVVIGAGTEATFNLKVTAVDGFSDPVQLTTTAYPELAVCTITPSEVVPTAQGTPATLSVYTTGMSPTSYTIGLRAKSGSIVRDLTVVLQITALELAVIPEHQMLPVGGVVGYVVTVTPVNGHAGPVALSVSGLGPGVGASFSNDQVDVTPGPQIATLTLADSSSSSPASSRTAGAMTFTITATGGGATASALASYGRDDNGSIIGTIK